MLIEEFRTVFHSNDMTNVVCSDATSIVASMTSDEKVFEFILYHAYAKFNYMQLLFFLNIKEIQKPNSRPLYDQ